LAQKQNKKEGKNALSEHLRGLFAAIGGSIDFQSNIASVRGGRGGGLKFIDVTQNFRIFIQKKFNKIRLSPNLESYLHMRIRIILAGGRGNYFAHNRVLIK